MKKDDLLEHILNLEWDMFTAVKSAYPVSCQSSPDKFRAIRGSIFTMWTEEMLDSYFIQLSVAQKLGRNLLTEKYARMDNLIPPLTGSPYLDEIVAISEHWQLEVQCNYPALYESCCRTMEHTGDGRNFSIYLRSELETYGDKTLELYHAYVKDAHDQGINLSLEALRHLVKESGYPGLELAESRLNTTSEK
ncbi:MAG: DUF4125 family protein [Desulfuromonadaceae bacterium]|nr:DUF4125 family protein [Desulfuromonadaceae bacterium]